MQKELHSLHDMIFDFTVKAVDFSVLCEYDKKKFLHVKSGASPVRIRDDQQLPEDVQGQATNTFLTTWLERGSR